MVISHEIAVYNDDALKKRFSSIQQTESAITLTVGQKVGYNEVISSINQTAEQIQISASKIDLRGYATFSDLPTKTSDLANDSNYVNTNQLSTAGQTVIHGGNITTGKISAQYLELSNYATIGQLPTKTSDLTNDSSFLNPTTLNNRLSTQGYTTINGGNITTGTIAGPSGTFSLNMLTGDVTMNNGHFSGEITASSGSIGGFTIESDYLHKGTTIGTANNFWLWPAGSDTSHKADISGSGNIAGWAMTVGSKYGVLSDGTVYSSQQVTKGTISVLNSSGQLEAQLNNTGLDVYTTVSGTAKQLGKIGSNTYSGGAVYLAVDLIGANADGFNITRRAVGSDPGKNLFQIEKDGTTAIHGDLSVSDSSGTARGITAAGDITAGGYFIGKLKTTNAGGFYTDVYGNFIHQSNVTSDTWNIKDKNENTNFSVEYQSGNTRILGTLAVTGATTISGAATVTGALAANGGISIPYGQVAVGYFEAPSANAWTTNGEGNLSHKSNSTSATFGIYSKSGAKAVKIKYESADVTTDGALTINGTLTGSESEKVEVTTYGVTATLYKNAGAVTAYIHGTTTAELSTSSGYIDFVPGTSYASWFPKAQIIGYQLYSRNGYRGQVKVLADRVQIGYTNNASGTAANIPSGTTIYIYVTWAAK